MPTAAGAVAGIEPSVTSGSCTGRPVCLRQPLNDRDAVRTAPLEFGVSPSLSTATIRLLIGIRVDAGPHGLLPPGIRVGNVIPPAPVPYALCVGP